MIGRRKKEEKKDDYIGPAKGWAKFFHRLFLFITFPLRKPWWTLLIVVVLFLAPTFRGVKPAEVHLWYWNHIKNSSSQVTEKVSDKAKALIEEVPHVVDVEPVSHPQEPSAKVVDMPVRSSGRKMFERAKSATVEVREVEPITQTDQKIQTNQKIQTEKKIATPKKLELVYLKDPKIISGQAEVVNANEMVVDGVDMFMYGIYSDPKSENGKKAEEYLRQTTKNQKVFCVIKAYTYQKIATGICSVGNKKLNYELVRLGYSKNVALD